MSAERGSAVSGGQRALAWLAIGCGLLLTVILVVFTVRSLPELAGVVVGAAVAGAGGWWLVTERPPRRWIGLAGLVVGLVIVVAAVIAAADGDRPLVNAALVLILFAVTVGSALSGHGAAPARGGCPPAACRRASPSSGAHLQPVVGRGEGPEVRFGGTGQ